MVGTGQRKGLVLEKVPSQRFSNAMEGPLWELQEWCLRRGSGTWVGGGGGEMFGF